MADISVDYDDAQLSAFCQRWQIAELSFFGSVLRDDFSPDSDIDILVKFHPDAKPTLFDMVNMRTELEALLGRRVDLVSRRGVEASRNPLRREAILTSAEVVYGS